ncbi:hypothetical protein SUGI_0538150 [Cryptomeria japonica]|nr:hypothetical protein SUGI_0538150 [Cryptomeria japonica]
MEVATSTVGYVASMEVVAPMVVGSTASMEVATPTALGSAASMEDYELELKNANHKQESGHVWKEFANYHSLKMGDFVVFKYIAKLYMEVDMFGRSGCVKNISACHFEFKKIVSTCTLVSVYVFFVCLSIFFRCYIFLAEERKGRAEEGVEQPRAKSSSRHEMHDPARVCITDEEKKIWEAMS